MTETITIVYRDITPAEAVVLAEHPKARASAWSDLMHERDDAKAALAAAEARNATLTDDAARYRFLRNWTRGVRSVEFGCADFAFPKIRVAAGVNVMRGAVCQHLDAAIDAELARAAASISTKGDGHG
ncbi:hypothetical protein LJR066_002786 [Acidovorax sp. LjRoot66]|uniref:hypothetical protein n=1 Tax=Acidovorax sp. LjRoot66 TaxID=3342334 RepID=UPI003ECD08BC